VNRLRLPFALTVNLEVDGCDWDSGGPIWPVSVDYYQEQVASEPEPERWVAVPSRVWDVDAALWLDYDDLDARNRDLIDEAGRRAIERG
jgi:hypothetical protein